MNTGAEEEHAGIVPYELRDIRQSRNWLNAHVVRQFYTNAIAPEMKNGRAVVK